MDEGEREPAAAPPAVRRTSPPRPRKPAGSAPISVADRIDPLMGGSSVEVAEAPPQPAPKRKPRSPAQNAPSGVDQDQSPRRPPAPRKRAPSTKPVAASATSTAEAVSTPVVVAEPPTAQLQVFDDLVVFDEPLADRQSTEPATDTNVDADFFDDLDFEKQVGANTDAVVAKSDAEGWVAQQVEARQPYVLPKIIPGEPDPATDEESTASPDELVIVEPALEPALEPTLTDSPIESENAFKPKVLRLTKKLARSLQPVIVPRQRPRVRRVTRVVRHIDTWSVFKIAVLFNIFLYAVCLIAGVMLWRVALNTGTIENIERFFESFGWQTFELKGGEIYHNAWIAGLFAVVGFTGLAVLAATMFNLITDLVGGVRLTVLEEEVTAREQRVTTWPRLLRPSPPPHREPPPD